MDRRSCEGRGRASDEGHLCGTRTGPWLDNGNLTPIEIPLTFSLAALDGKSAKEQMVSILTARCEEIEQTIKKLKDEKKVLEDGIESGVGPNYHVAVQRIN